MMFYLGLDIGKAADYTAVNIAEKIVVKKPEVDAQGKPLFETQIRTRHIHRFPLKTEYVDIALAVLKMTQTPQLAGKCQVIADATGVGMPVVEMMVNLGVKNVVPVVITGGNNELFDENTGAWHVPKKVLVSTLLILFGHRQLKFADGLPEKQVIITELQNFKLKVTAKGNDTYEAWRDSDHDDMVLALALSCWYADKFGSPNIPRKVISEAKHPFEMARKIL